MGRAPLHVQSYYREQLAHLHDNQVPLLKDFIIFFVEYFSFTNLVFSVYLGAVFGSWSSTRGVHAWNECLGVH